MDLQLARDAQTYRLVAVSMTCCVVYDAILTLPDELRYVWRRRITLPRLLFACARLLSLSLLSIITVLSFVVLSDTSCRAYLSLVRQGAGLVSIPTDGLLLWRVLALFVHKPNLRNGLLGYFCVQKTLEIVAPYSMGAAILRLSSPEVPGCYSTLDLTAFGNALPIVHLPANLVFNLTLLLLTIYNPHTRAAHGTGELIPILRVLQRSGSLYFAIYLVLMAVTAVLVVGFSGRPSLQSLSTPIMIAGYSILSGRLYLHLKRSRMPELTTKDFAQARTPITRGVEADASGRTGRSRASQHGDESYDSWSDESEDEGPNANKPPTQAPVSHKSR